MRNEGISGHTYNIEQMQPPQPTIHISSDQGDAPSGASLALPSGAISTIVLEAVRTDDGVLTDFLCLDLNEASATALGLDAALVRGRPTSEFPEIRFSSEMIDRSLEALTTGADATFFDVLEMPTGERRRLRTTIAPLGDTLIVVAENISDEWLESERMSRLVERAPMMIVVMDQMGNIRWASDGSRQVLGLEPEALLGPPQVDKLHPSDAPTLLNAVSHMQSPRRRSDTPESSSLEYRIRNADGQYRWINFVVEDFTGVESIDGLVCYGQDVTERRFAAEFAALDAEIHGAIVAGTPFDLVLQSLCDRLNEIIEAVVVWVGLAEEDGSVAVRGASGPIDELFRGVTPRWDDSPVGQGPVGECIRRRRTVQMESTDPSLRSLDNHVASAISRLGIRGGVAIPLIADNVVVGALGINVEDPRQLNPSTIATLEGIASWIAVAISMNRGRQRERLLAAALAAAANSVAITDARGRISWVNDSYLSTTGTTFAEAVGRIPEPLDDPLGRSPQSREMWAAISNNRSWSGEVNGRRADGDLYRVIKTITPLFSSADEIEHFVIIQEDVSELRETESRLERATTRDLLTGLPNRRSFLDGLDEVIRSSGSDGHWTVIACLNLDNFRAINEREGMDRGDRALIRLADRLHTLVRSDDQLARLGADSFAISVSGLLSRSQAVQRLEQLRSRLQRSNAEYPSEVITTGVVVIEPASLNASASDVLRDAELAMRQAKGAGGGFAFFNESIRTEVQERLNITEDLRQAIANKDLIVHYQPQFSLQSGGLVGVEALVRWHHAERGMLAPAVFLPIAEDAGLIPSLDHLVREIALAQLQTWLGRHESDDVPRISLNLSPVEFSDAGLAEEIAETIARYGCPPSKVTIEILETSIVSDEAAELVTALSEIGVNLAIDDFGTGYSSLAYLSTLPVNELKIDRSFVQRLDVADDRSRAVVSATIRLGHELGMEITAEGVETPNQERILVELGCDLVQGYLRSRPVPAETIEALIAEHAAGK